jgi:hypothetical protein
MPVAHAVTASALLLIMLVLQTALVLERQLVLERNGLHCGAFGKLPLLSRVPSGSLWWVDLASFFKGWPLPWSFSDIYPSCLSCIVCLCMLCI